MMHPQETTEVDTDRIEDYHRAAEFRAKATMFMNSANGWVPGSDIVTAVREAFPHLAVINDHNAYRMLRMLGESGLVDFRKSGKDYLYKGKGLQVETEHVYGKSKYWLNRVTGETPESTTRDVVEAEAKVQREPKRAKQHLPPQVQQSDANTLKVDVDPINGRIQFGIAGFTIDLGIKQG
jgi:hypothetical protein